MPQGKSLLDTAFEAFAAPHPDGYKFIATAVGAAIVALLVGWSFIAFLALLAAAFIAYFFRDPDRVTPLREGLVLAAADGVVTSIEAVTPAPELGLGAGDRVRVSTYLSMFDVHVNRAPIAGRIKRSVYIPGAFLNATLDKSSDENERRAVLIETSQGVEVGVIQIAGVVSRRIITFVAEGESVGVGQRIGLIRFGSRVDIYLPPGRHALVAVGQRMVAGETVVADLRSDEPAREARRV